MFSLAVVLTIVSASLYAGAKDNELLDENRRKADYIYLEAQRTKIKEGSSGFVSKLERAYRLDTAETVVGSDLGYIYLRMGEAERGYEMMKRHFIAHPEDYYNTSAFALVVSRMGDIDMAIRAFATLDSMRPHRTEIVTEYAKAIASKGDTASVLKAIALLSDHEKFQNHDPETGLLKIHLYDMLGDTLAMINGAKSQIEYSPLSSDAYFLTSTVFSYIGQPDSAKWYIDRAIDLDPLNSRARYYRAVLNKEAGDSVAYEDDVFEVLTSPDTDTSVREELIRDYVTGLYEDTLQFPRITRMFDRMIEANPHDPVTRRMYGAFKILEEDYSGAAEQYEVSADLTPEDIEAQLMSVRLYQYSGDTIKAEARLVEIEPRFEHEPRLYSTWSNLYVMTGRYDDALAKSEYAYALTDSTDNVLRSELMQGIGDIRVQLGDTITGVECYERAYALNPSNIVCANNLAYFLTITGGDLDRAERMSYSTIIEQPDNETFLDTYAWIKFKLKDYAKAKEYIDRALEADDALSPEIFEHAGDIYFFNELPDEAVEFWERALETSEAPSPLLKKKVELKTYQFK